MRLLPIALTVFSIFGSGIFRSNSDAFDFDRLRPGTLPPGWTTVVSRKGEADRWEIRSEATAPSRPNVIAHVGEPANGNGTEGALAIFDRAACYDGDLSVKFRIESATNGARSAGIVWRYQDPGNYYLLRFSVDESSIVLFRFLNGRPQMVSEGARTHDLRAGQWYIAKVVFRGDKVRVLFGNRLLFDASDTAISKPGKTGLRARSDVTVDFDDFRIDRKG